MKEKRKMKTINGKNKNIRNITKAKKYFGVQLWEQSNKFYKIMNKKELTNLFMVANGSWKLVKNGELVVIQPENATGVFFVKSWATIITSDNNLIWAPFTQKDKDELNKLSVGYDDVFKVVEIENDILIKRKNTFGNQL